MTRSTTTPCSPKHPHWVLGYEDFAVNPKSPPQPTTPTDLAALQRRAGWFQAQQDRFTLSIHEQEI